MKFCTEWWVYYASAESSVTLLNVGSFLPPDGEFLGITFIFSTGRLAVSELSGTLRSFILKFAGQKVFFSSSSSSSPSSPPPPPSPYYYYYYYYYYSWTLCMTVCY